MFLAPIEEALHSTFLPALFGSGMDGEFCNLLANLVKQGGLGIRDTGFGCGCSRFVCGIRGFLCGVDGVAGQW